MPPTQPHFLPYVIAALLLFAVYRRIRRNFGRQLLRPVRMSIRVVILLALAACLVPAAIASRTILLMELAGVCVGIALGVWGAERTRYIRHAGALHYLPHTYTGIAVTALFLGRLVYRLATTGWSAGSQGFAPYSMVQSPVTVAIFFVLIGYYVVYYGVVLYKAKHLTPEDIEPMPDAMTTSQQ